MGDKASQIWKSLDVKKLLCFLCSLIVTLLVYIRNTDMNTMERNHKEQMAAIQELKEQVSKDKDKSIAKMDSIENRVRSTEIDIAKLQIKER